MNGRIAKWSEMWYSGGGGVVVTCIWGIFDLLVFNVILGSFSTLVSKWPVTGKRLAVKPNGVKFRSRG